MTVHVITQKITVHLIQSGLSAKYGAGKRASFIARAVQALCYKVIRRILVHIYLFQYYAPLIADVILVESGIEQHVAYKLDQRPQIAVKDPAVKACTFLCCKCVCLTSDFVHKSGNFRRAPTIRPLENHMLDKMGNSALL